MTQLPFGGPIFDVVTTFETIEHVFDFMACLREFRRVLKEDGILLCSIPNKAITSPNGVILNPYHVREFTVSEFQQALSKIFCDVCVLGQWCRRELRAPLISRLVWRALTLRGIRKIPWRIRKAISQVLTRSPLYPAPEKFVILPESSGARTLIGVCRKRVALEKRP